MTQYSSISRTENFYDMQINYLCTYDLYGPVRKVLDLGR